MDPVTQHERLLRLEAAKVLIDALEADLRKVAENPQFHSTADSHQEFQRIIGLLETLAELIRFGGNNQQISHIAFDVIRSCGRLSHEFFGKVLDIDERQLITRLSENAEKLGEKLFIITDDEQRSLKRSKNRIDPAELQEKYAALSGAAESMRQALAAAEARIAALSELGSKSAEKIDELTSNLGWEAKKQLGLQLTGLNVDINNFHEEIRSRSEEFEGYKKQAIDMLGQMSATVLSGGYLGSARREESAANLFRWLCISMMGITVIFLGFTIYQLSFDNLDWKIALTRLLATLLMAVPTAYLARESGKHRIQSNRLRKTSLDFSVLEPFLKSVEGDVGSTLRSELARRVFFSDVDEDKASSYPMEPQVIILKALDAMAKMSKR